MATPGATTTSARPGGQAVRGRRALVLGLGLTGLSAARWLAARGADVVVADTRQEPPFEAALAAGVPGARLVKGPLRDAWFRGRDLIVVSPGLRKDLPEVLRAASGGVDVVGDVELFARAVPGGVRVVGITGSNGKSTVTALTGELVAASGGGAVVAGNIGTPVLDALDAWHARGSPPEVFVLELSSYQLETTSSLALVAATVLNVTENHFDRYDGLASYARAKARIFEHAAAQVLNRDDPFSSAMRSDDRACVSFGADAPPGDGDWGIVARDDAPWLASRAGALVVPWIACRELALVGRHNAQNALAALALAASLGVDASAPVLDALRRFGGLPHRMTRVASREGVDFVDDSKATTVAAATAALEGIGRPAVLIAGGDGKGQDFSPLADPVARRCRAVLLLGRDARAIEAALAGSGVPLSTVATIEEAVARAAAIARAGDVVLLSPACASLDMFRDFGHRGDAFAAAVRALGARASDG